MRHAGKPFWVEASRGKWPSRLQRVARDAMPAKALGIATNSLHQVALPVQTNGTARHCLALLFLRLFCGTNEFAAL